MQSFDDLHDFIKSNDNHTKFFIKSKVPQICKSEPCILGVDEAGRGPVLGPMVYGVTYCPISQKQVLKNLGCADSKLLKEEKRDEIVLKMLTEKEPLDNVGWITEVISPNHISNSMYKRTKCSLNKISMDSAVNLIENVIDHGANIKEIFVDTVGPPQLYQDILCKVFPNITITVAKKADSLYPIVSAASVIAKVTRDHALQVWQFKEGEVREKYGSGYPGDPATKKFLQRELDKVFGFPSLVRFSWSTTEVILKDNAVKCCFEDAGGGASAPTKSKGNQSKISFFVPKTKRKQERYKYFQNRCLFTDDAFQ